MAERSYFAFLELSWCLQCSHVKQTQVQAKHKEISISCIGDCTRVTVVDRCLLVVVLAFVLHM